MTEDINQIVANAAMFERLEHGKGKFNTISAVFDDNEPVGEVLRWAHEKAVESRQEVVKVELHRDER